jgi:hypothetical protein
MVTLARVVPSWLASAPITYTYLDAAWAQYRSSKGDVARFAASEIAAAKTKGLGVMVGLNILNGGNGSSGIRGTKSGEYSMSATELKTYGTAMLSNPYVCGFMMWEYNLTYYGRSDIKSAMAELSPKASSHPQTSCRQ